MVWYDVGTAQYGVVWYGVVWYGVVWYGRVWCGVVWYCMVWPGIVWCGVWCGMACYSMVWYGIVWHGMVHTVFRTNLCLQLEKFHNIVNVICTVCAISKVVEVTMFTCGLVTTVWVGMVWQTCVSTVCWWGKWTSWKKQYWHFERQPFIIKKQFIHQFPPGLRSQPHSTLVWYMAWYSMIMYGMVFTCMVCYSLWSGRVCIGVVPGYSIMYS